MQLNGGFDFCTVLFCFKLVSVNCYFFISPDFVYSSLASQMMANPELMRMASETMMNMKPEDLRTAAEQLKHANPQDMAEIGEKMAKSTPEEITAMRAQADSQITYQISAAQMLKKQVTIRNQNIDIHFIFTICQTVYVLGINENCTCSHSFKRRA